MNEWTVPGQEEEPRSLHDYVAMVRRRKWYLIVPAVLILAGSVAVAFALPPLYRSTGKILIERQEIPNEWVQATVTSFADQRIQTISQRVLTTANLTRVVEKFNLYTEARKEQSMEEVVQRMRDNFNVETISAQVRNPQTGRSGVATIAFSVSFDHRSPAVAQRVANELVSLYLEENVKTRTEAVKDTARFLEEEANKLGARLSDMEGRIAAFKKKNMGRLPEQQDLNMQLLQKTEQALVQTRSQIQSLQERKTYLETALAQMKSRSTIDSTGGQSDPTDLQSLRARYASLSAVYADDHPDLVRLRRQIAALEQEGAGEGRAAIEAQLQALRQQLSAKRERYADDHPDVQRLRKEISSLEDQLDRTAAAPPANDGATDPVLIKTRADLNSVESDLKTLHQQAKKYTDMIQSLEQRIAETPGVEQEYQALVRDHDNLEAKYRDIRAKQSSARVSEALEADRKGERFSLIEPPQLPREPIKPDRFKILMLGFAGSLFGGVGSLFAREELDHGVRTSSAVVRATDAPVLAVIPRIGTGAERRRTRRNRLLLLLGFLMCIAVGLVLVHLYYKPLDTLWYAALRRLESL